MSAGSPIIKGDNTVVFGSGGVYTTGIIVTTASNKLDGDMLEIKDNNGFVVAVIFYNDKNELSFEMIVQTTAPTLKRGDVITIAGVATAIVKDTELKYTQDNVQKFAVNATSYAGLTLGS